MDEKLTGFITTELKIGKLKAAPIDLLLIAATYVFGILMRSKIWKVDAIWDTGTAIMALDQQKMLVIGIAASVVASVICAVYVYMLTSSKIRAYIALAVIFLSPSMAISDSMAKAADGIYLFLFITALLLFTRKKYIPAGLSFILSIAAYIIVIGFSPWYEEMYKGPKLLSYEFPNVYQLLGPDAFVPEYTKAGYALTLAVFICCCIWAKVHVSGATEEDEKIRILKAALIFSWLVTYIMPGMDEHSGLLPMALSLILAVAKPKYYYIAIAEQIFMFLPWAAFFRGGSFWPLSYAALLRLIMILWFICRSAVESGPYEKEEVMKDDR